jgi:ABC-2 type transport system permease protein
MSAITKLTISETRLFFREPIGVFFTVLFPPVLLGILGAVPSFREPDKGLGGLRVIDLYIPIAIAMAVALFSLSGLPQLLATYREKGILRRLKVTPARPVTMLGAQLLMCTALSVVTMLLIVAVGRIAFNVALPDQIPAYLVAYLLSAVSMLAIGLLVASLAPTAKGAGAIGTLLFFPIIFFAGLWAPREVMPELLRKISDFTPLGAGVQSLQDAATGSWPQLLHIAVLLGWTVVAGGLAARYFRWE